MSNECKSQKILNLLGNKWLLTILKVISINEVIRFNNLQKELLSVSSRTLSKRLTELIDEKIITKKIYAEIPIKVEYSLTTKGKDLILCFKNLDKWVEIHG